ncbi:hypothetical protein ABZT03_10000 [Streptomyces sp. NPDC005574]
MAGKASKKQAGDLRELLRVPGGERPDPGAYDPAATPGAPGGKAV